VAEGAPCCYTACSLLLPGSAPSTSDCERCAYYFFARAHLCGCCWHGGALAGRLLRPPPTSFVASRCMGNFYAAAMPGPWRFMGEVKATRCLDSVRASAFLTLCRLVRFGIALARYRCTTTFTVHLPFPNVAMGWWWSAALRRRAAGV